MDVLPIESINHVKNKMLIDVQYAKRKGKGDEAINDYIYMIWRDLDTGEKHMSPIESPTVPIYFEKEESRDYNLNRQWQYKDRLNRKIVKFRDIIPAIAEEAGKQAVDNLRNAYQTHNFGELNNFFRYPYSYGADYDARFFYRYFWFKNDHSEKQTYVTKGFSDIEVDLTNNDNKFPTGGIHAVELITLVDPQSKTSYTFILRGMQFIPRNIDPENTIALEKEKERKDDYDEKNRQQDEFLKDLDGFEKELHETFDELYGSFDYKFYVYDDERKMLTDYFNLVKILKLDFMLFWNMSFDVPYMWDRAIVLGMDPVQLYTHPDFPNREARFIKDNNPKHKAIKTSSDCFEATGYTVWHCQERLYAQVRKGEPELKSYKLNDIAKKEIDDSKFDYSEEGNLRKFACHNYRKYVLYNIKDVLLQYGIERRTEDVDNYWSMSYLNCTPYKDVFKQTSVLRNSQYIYYERQNVIPGNNVNKLNFYEKEKQKKELMEIDPDAVDDDDDKKEGALVGNPLLVRKFGMELYGKRSSHCFLYNIDMDMTAFYPHTNISHNINELCLCFRVSCPVTVFDIRGGSQPWKGITDKYIAPPIEGKVEEFYTEDAAKEIFDNLQTGNILSTGYKFLNMPSVDDMYASLLIRMGDI